MRVSESLQLIPVLEAADYEAGIDFDSVHMGRLLSLSFQMLFGAITGDAVLKFYCGATEGTKTTAIAFNYRIGGGAFKAASADILGDIVAVASTGLTLTAATFTHKEVVVEIDSDTVLDGKPWVTGELSAAASVLLVGVGGIGYPRYAGHTVSTAIK